MSSVAEKEKSIDLANRRRTRSDGTPRDRLPIAKYLKGLAPDLGSNQGPAD